MARRGWDEHDLHKFGLAAFFISNLRQLT